MYSCSRRSNLEFGIAGSSHSVENLPVLSFAIIITPKTHVFAYLGAVLQYVKGTRVIYLHGRRKVWMLGKLIGCRDCLLILWKDAEVLPGVRGNVSQCTRRRSLMRRRRVGVYNLICFWSSEFLYFYYSQKAASHLVAFETIMLVTVLLLQSSRWRRSMS